MKGGDRRTANAAKDPCFVSAPSLSRRVSQNTSGFVCERRSSARSLFKGQHFTPYFVKLGESGCCTKGSRAYETRVSMAQPDFDYDIWLVCTVVHARFTKVIGELMFPLSVEHSFESSREVVSAILCARRWGVTEAELVQKLLGFSHAPDLQSLPVISELHKQIVQAFIRAVYNSDDGFDMMLKCKSPIARTTSGFFQRCMNLDRRLGNGVSLEELCREQCKVRLGDLQREVMDQAPSVATREQLPRRWANMLTCIVIFLRGHADFA